jgi:bacillithiol biosynthesis deacetylase BshB1
MNAGELRQTYPAVPVPEGFKADVLVFSPHPDDAEIGTGGVLAKMKAVGAVTAIVDLTEGEMASGGTVEIRREECKEAAKILKLDYRGTLGLPDCGLDDTFEYRQALARAIRILRPEVIFAPYFGQKPGRGRGHNDHIKAGILASHAFNYAHLAKLEPGLPPHQARALFYYFLPSEVTPTFIVPVDDYYQQWIDSIMAHRSQFGDPEKNPEMRVFFESHARQFGRLMSCRYAQAYLSEKPLAVLNPLEQVLSACKD